VVVNNSKKIRFKYLVGADGSLSIVRNYLGITSEKIGLAMQYLIKTKKYKQLEMFLDSDLFDAWYAWIFPHKHYVSIGFGCYPRWFPVKKMLDNFDKWLKEKKIDVSGERYEAHTINADFKGYKFGNIFLVGDAAGLTPGFTGKGIYPAFVSGEEVAKLIIDKNYVSKKMDRLIKIAKRQKNFVTLLHSIGPFRMIIYEFLTLLLRNKYLEKVILRHALE
jgi:geranylgeranyl reductase